MCCIVPFIAAFAQAIGRGYGSLPRFTTTYDITFLSLLVHDALNQDVAFSEERCVGNPFKKKVMIKDNPLLLRLCAANVVLSYYKLCDDVIDGGGGKKRIARAALRKSYIKASEALPAVDTVVKMRYASSGNGKSRRNQHRSGCRLLCVAVKRAGGGSNGRQSG